MQQHNATSKFPKIEYNNEWNPDADECDILETGFSHELMTSEIYLPCHASRQWVRCFLVEGEDQSYRLYLEGSRRFLLSAKLVDKIFYISSHEDFPCYPNVPTRGIIATLRPRKDSGFLLCSTHCRYCDYDLGRYYCCTGSTQREVLAKINHTQRKHRKANVDLKCTLVTVPVIQNNRRLVWCPRAFRSHKINTNDIGDFVHELTPVIGMRLVNRLPEWDDELKCLVLKFQSDRIRCASSRNVLIYDEHDLQGTRKRKTEKLTAEDAILQFGKSAHGKYALDFKYPLSPLQAFAIGLTTFTYPDSPI